MKRFALTWLNALILALVFATPLASAATAVALAPETTRVSLNAQSGWWKPAQANASLADARAATFTPAPAGPGYGLPDGPVWFRFLLRNDAAFPRDFLLEAAFAKIDYLDVYRLHTDGRVTQVQTGERRAWSTRALAAPHFLFPLQLAAGETAEVYLRVETGAVLNIPLLLHDEHAYLAQANTQYAWMGLFYGLVLGLLVYNAYLFRATREMAFLYYVSGGVLALGYFLSIDGLLAAWLPQHPVQAQWLLFMGASLSAAFTLQFSRMFLELKRLAPRLDRALLGAAAMSALVAVLIPLLPPLLCMTLTIVVSVAMASLMSVAGWLSWRSGFPPARWFVLAIGAHLLVLTLVSLTLLAVVPLSFDTTDALHRAGFVLNLLCFTLAIGDRIGMIDRQARDAEERAIAAAADIRARNAFLSRMSHELRTPMTGVLGMAELLEHTELSAAQRRYLGTLRYSGDMLLTLINDVLDHARMQAGRLQLAREAFDLLKVVDECRTLFAQQPRDNGVTLHVDIGSGVSRVAVGDAQRVRQVLVNLLAQAFRQTRQGHVKLRLRDAGQYLRFEIEAAAEGGDEARALLAEEGEGARGTLGLGISRRLVEAMGGRIGIAAADAGHPVAREVTLFWVEMPINAADARE